MKTPCCQGTLDRLNEIIQFINEQNSLSRTVVHCAEGMGRTGTVFAAYLVSYGLGSNAAIRCVRDKRPGSIQSPEQERAMHDFQTAIQKEKSHNQTRSLSQSGRVE